MPIFSIGHTKYWKKRRVQALTGLKNVQKLFKRVYIHPPQSHPVHTNDTYLDLYNKIDFRKMTSLNQNIRLPFLDTVTPLNNAALYDYINNPYSGQADIVSAQNDLNLVQERRNSPLIQELISLKNVYISPTFSEKQNKSRLNKFKILMRFFISKQREWYIDSRDCLVYKTLFTGI